jgi:type I restriction enzyme S subunit
MNVPKIRFKPDVGGAYPEWVSKPLKEVCKKIKDGTHFSPKSKSGPRKYITSKNIRNGGLDLSNCSYISDEEHREIYRRCPVELGDILLTKDGAGTGNCCANTLTEEFSLLSSVAVLSGEEGILSNEFLLQILQSELGQNAISNVIAGQAITRITLDKINKFTFMLPHYDEQQKIASFLSAVDQKISLLTKRHDLLIQYKKGVMQKIFNQEIRFKDEGGKDFPGWVECLLGDICEPRQHKTISGGQLLSSGYPVYGANGLIGYYDSYNHEFETVAVTCRGATCGEVTLVPAKSWITGNSMSLDSVNQNENNHKFIYYAIINRGFKDIISGSAQPQIVGSAIRSVKFTIPKLDEQTKIANFISAIDDGISLAWRQVEVTRQYKQGLLQQMFI